MGNNIQHSNATNHIEEKEPSDEIDDEADNKSRRRQNGNNIHAKIIKFRNRHFHKNKQKKLRSERDTLYDSTISTLPISNGNLPKHKSYLTLDEIRNIQVHISQCGNLRNFFVVQILREINFGESINSKTGEFSISGSLNFVDLVDSSL